MRDTHDGISISLARESRHGRIIVRARSPAAGRAQAHEQSSESGRVAQLGERCVRNAEVGSSILPASTILRSRESQAEA